MQCMGPNKALKNLKEDITGFEENSWLCNFAFSKILINFDNLCFWETGKKRLSLKTQSKIEFLLLFTSSRKVVGKMPRLLVDHTLIII